MNRTVPLPRMPALLSRPLKLLPPVLFRQGLSRALNLLFAAPLAAGELDFLAGRRVRVRIPDAPIRFTLGVRQGELVVGPGEGPADLEIEGVVYAFMLLASRQEDADTLFFQRQLRVQGDTELGLQVKNFLDGLDPSTLPLHGLIEAALRRGLHLADRIDRLLPAAPEVPRRSSGSAGDQASVW